MLHEDVNSASIRGQLGLVKDIYLLIIHVHVDEGGCVCVCVLNSYIINPTLDRLDEPYLKVYESDLISGSKYTY